MAEAGVTVTACAALEIASVIARRGGAAALAGQVAELFGFGLASGPKRSGAEDVVALGVGPGRWLFMRESGAADFAATLAERLHGLAAVADQSDGYAVLDVAGAGARWALAKGVAVDLHPSVFTISDVAATRVAHVGIVLWQPQDGMFRLAVPRSYLGSFRHWLQAAAGD